MKAGVDQAQAAGTVSQYGTVLVAHQDVEDQLASLHYLSRQFDAENGAVTSLGRTWQEDRAEFNGTACRAHP
jgi:hypothetical protein